MSESTQPPTPPPIDRKRNALVRSLPLLLFTLCALGVIAFIVVRNYAALSGAAEIFDETAGVCVGQGAAGAAPYTPTPGVHPVVAFQEGLDGRIEINREYVLPAWLPQSLAQTELVLCAEFERPAYRTLCASNAAGEEVQVEYGRELFVTLRAAQTAEIVAEGFISSVPAAVEGCLDEVPANLPDPQTPVSPERVQVWLRPFVVQ